MRLIFFVVCCCIYSNSNAIVKYDEGNIMIDGIQFLQDREDPRLYYYLPQYPRLARKEDGSLELLCMKYIGQGGAETNGGIFHALIEFTLPQKMIEDLEGKLKAKVGNSASIEGPVNLQQALKDGESGLASFQVISSILTNTTGANPFTKTIITSGHAPFLPGSKAAIAARLSQEGATLLFKSLEGGTSDVSVTLSGFYEAAVRAYNAIVEAESSVVYKHISSVYNKQEGFKKDEIRKVTDELIRNQSIKVDVFDRSAALSINAKDMDGILSIITDKLIEVMFNAEKGWAKDPERIVAVGQSQIPLRQERGAFAQFFAGTGNQEYVSDDQFSLKNYKDIRSNKIMINLSKSTTIKVPVYASGNLAGLYNELKSENQYFKTVNLDDPDFQKREIVFQVDGQFAETFNDVFNSVTVSFKKKYSEGGEEVTRDLIFDKKSIEAGNNMQHVLYPRLGIKSSDWLNYQYRISWSLKGQNTTIDEPKQADQWKTAKSPAIILSPPFTKRIIEIDADRILFKERNVISAAIRFLSVINGKPQYNKTLVLRTTDAVSTNKIALYADYDGSFAYQVTWNIKDKEIKDEVKILDTDYLILNPKE